MMHEARVASTTDLGRPAGGPDLRPSRGIRPSRELARRAESADSAVWQPTSRPDAGPTKSKPRSG